MERFLVLSFNRILGNVLNSLTKEMTFINIIVCSDVYCTI
jgi:hypothetical protein